MFFWVMPQHMGDGCQHVLTSMLVQHNYEVCTRHIYSIDLLQTKLSKNFVLAQHSAQVAGGDGFFESMSQCCSHYVQ